MEEDIKILEDLINRFRNGISLGVVNEWNPSETFAQAIENLINRNKELEKEMTDFRDCWLHKDKIREKIKQYKEQGYIEIAGALEMLLEE